MIESIQALAMVGTGKSVMEAEEIVNNRQATPSKMVTRAKTSRLRAWQQVFDEQVIDGGTTPLQAERR